jgi:uracil-DNA glycosylase
MIHDIPRVPFDQYMISSENITELNLERDAVMNVINDMLTGCCQLVDVKPKLVLVDDDSSMICVRKASFDNELLPITWWPYIHHTDMIVTLKSVTGSLPPPNDVFTAFRLCDLNSIKVVILGQDPYINPGEAHGLSFSVRQGVKIPPSLRNIYSAIRKFDDHFIIPHHGELTEWAKRGIFLLNSALTVIERSPGSHMDVWRGFTDSIIKLISDTQPKVVFMLWGAFAQKKAALIDASKHVILKYSHPSPTSRIPFNCDHFKIAKELTGLDFSL